MEEKIKSDVKPKSKIRVKIIPIISILISTISIVISSWILLKR